MSKTVKLQWLGRNVSLPIPGDAARQVGFKPGSFVRVIVLKGELRVRPVAMPRVDDLNPDLDTPDSERQEASGFMMRW
jgi:antitoxin component of MazEF toxin-antitoxin module